MGRASLDNAGLAGAATDTEPWTEVPELALNSIFLEIGLRSLQQCFLVCKRWLDLKNQDGFWRGLVKSEFGVLRDDLPADVKSWAEYAKLLHTRKIHMLELGPKLPKEISFKYGNDGEGIPRGLLDVSMSKVMDCFNGDVKEVFVFMCITASSELLLWAGDMFSGIDVQVAFDSYTAAFKGLHAVDRMVLEVSGAMVSTHTGQLYETVAWGHKSTGAFVVDFEQVHLPGDQKVVSFAMCCSGVRVAVMADSSVFVWGKVFGLLFEQVGVNPSSLFGLGEGSPNVVPDGALVTVKSPIQMQFHDIAEGDGIVQIVAGNSHFLALSRCGEVWAWGFSGCDDSGAAIRISDSPKKMTCPAIKTLHNPYMLETVDGKLLAYAEFVCGGGNRLMWTPMYNLQYDAVFGPAAPNTWPWEEGELGVVRAHAREIGEMPLPSAEPMTAGCVGYTKHNEGCLRIHVYSDDECKTSQEPLHVRPMFDIGSNISFGKKGNLYFGSEGRVVVKDVRRALVKDQFYLLDLKSLGIPLGGSLTVDRPCGGWLIAMSHSG
ncbi:hypothetical protein BSKO_13492 [Bryopsis sp. KO-2023]|nr:hypothetical protein BSKO_13492 [Bryopsis sp. KO-2023]